MTLKIASLLLLFLILVPGVNFQRLEVLNKTYLLSAISVVITSFGFSNIIPSLRTYFNSDVKKLRLAIFIGSLIPLVGYLIWVGIVLADVPLRGSNGLLQVFNSSTPTTSLINALDYYVKSPSVNVIVHCFTSICVATSFLGVSLSLSDFLADGFRVQKEGKMKVLIFLATFVPPLLVVLFYPSAFILCLSYAGILCLLLLVILPAIMTWQGRYRREIVSAYKVKGGKTALILVTSAAIIIIAHEVFSAFKILS